MPLGIIIVDHGSRRTASNEMLNDVVRMFRQRSGYRIVEPAHMELAEPTIDVAFTHCVEQGADTIVVYPHFLLPGRHWYEDLPKIVSRAAEKHNAISYRISQPIGQHPLLSEIILQRVQECLRQETR